MLNKRVLILRLFIFIAVTMIFISGALAETNKTIRVGIVPEADTITISTSSRGVIFQTAGTPKKLLDIQPLQLFTITNKNGLMEIAGGNKKLTVGGSLIIRNEDEKSRYVPLVYAGNWFRGNISIFPAAKNKNKLTVVNSLPLEQYLYGVVPSEMPGSWPIEALKTQAIAARTYALSNIGKYGKDGFDVMPTTDSQVYKGATAESPTTNKAVDETIGKVITYDNKLIIAYYSAGAGGVTESGYDAWGKEYPYLKPVKDFDYDSPRYIWYTSLSNNDISWVLKKEFNISIGKITDIKVLDRTSSGRVKNLLITGTQGNYEVDGRKFRLAAKLNSTLFNVGAQDLGMSEDNNTFIPTLFMFTGRGWGHGSGLSQWGARQLAKDGKDAEYIITHYYQGTEIVDYSTVVSLK